MTVHMIRRFNWHETTDAVELRALLATKLRITAINYSAALSPK